MNLPICPHRHRVDTDHDAFFCSHSRVRAEAGVVTPLVCKVCFVRELQCKSVRRDSEAIESSTDAVGHQRSPLLLVLVTCYNCRSYISACISSIRSQTYTQWRCVIMDDVSTDGSSDAAWNAIEGDPRFEVIANESKHYQAGNYHQVLTRSSICDDDIVVTVDGDDWLPESTVFEKVVGAYADGSTWFTYGQYLIYQSGRLSRGWSALSPDVTMARYLLWQIGPLRTFKAHLWRAIDPNDLRGPTGEFWEVTGDAAFVYPMLEMAGNERVKFMPDITYCYNVGNPLNDHKLHSSRQQLYERLIRTKQRYSVLTEPFASRKLTCEFKGAAFGG